MGIVVITGGSRGIGASTAIECARRGMGIVLTYNRNPVSEAQSQTALGRVGEPEEVARVVATLLTEDAGWVNAQSIEVAGGYAV